MEMMACAVHERMISRGLTTQIAPSPRHHSLVHSFLTPTMRYNCNTLEEASFTLLCFIGRALGRRVGFGFWNPYIGLILPPHKLFPISLNGKNYVLRPAKGEMAVCAADWEEGHKKKKDHPPYITAIHSDLVVRTSRSNPCSSITCTIYFALRFYLAKKKPPEGRIPLANFVEFASIPYRPYMFISNHFLPLRNKTTVS